MAQIYDLMAIGVSFVYLCLLGLAIFVSGGGYKKWQNLLTSILWDTL